MDLTHAYLDGLGVHFCDSGVERAFLEAIQEALETRIGERISENMPEEKLDQFYRIKDERVAAEWLERNRPDYRDIVSEEIDRLSDELVRYKGQIAGIAAESQPNAHRK